ncbi:Thiol-disulfide oxidoreductase ResA [subsurface metagenome]
MFAFKNQKNNYLTILLIVALLLSFCIVSFTSTTFKKGFPAPLFSLKTIEGETFNLEDFKEKQKLLILYFCSRGDECSIEGIEEIVKYFEEHITEEKYEVFLINTKEDLKEEDTTLIKEFWLNKKIEFGILLDEEGEVAKLYNIGILPTIIFLGKNLVVKRVYPGLISKQQTLMFQYINYLLDCREKESPKKKEKEKEKNNCEGPCEPPPGY